MTEWYVISQANFERGVALWKEAIDEYLRVNEIHKPTDDNIPDAELEKYDSLMDAAAKALGGESEDAFETDDNSLNILYRSPPPTLKGARAKLRKVGILVEGDRRITRDTFVFLTDDEP